MLQTAQRRAEELGIRNVRFKQIDAETSIDLEAASVDGVLCRWGYMLVADPETALRETRRVLQARPPRRAGRVDAAGGEPLELAAGPRARRARADGAAGPRPCRASSRGGGRASSPSSSRPPASPSTTSRRSTSRSPTARPPTGGTPARRSPRFIADAVEQAERRRPRRGRRRDRRARRAVRAAGRHAADPGAHLGGLGRGLTQTAAANRSSSSGQPCGELIAAS